MSSTYSHDKRDSGGEIYSLRRLATEPSVLPVKCWKCDTPVAIYAASHADVARERRNYLLRATVSGAVAVPMVWFLEWAVREGAGVTATFLIIGALLAGGITLACLARAAFGQECGVSEEAPRRGRNGGTFHEAEFAYRRA